MGPSPLNWENLGGSFFSAVTAVTSSFFGTNRIDIFGIGSDKALYHKAWTGTAWEPSGTAWTKHYGSFGSEPAVASRGCNRLDIFGLAPAGDMSHQAWNGTGWAPAIASGESLGGSFKILA